MAWTIITFTRGANFGAETLRQIRSATQENSFLLMLCTKVLTIWAIINIIDEQSNPPEALLINADSYALDQLAKLYDVMARRFPKLKLICFTRNETRAKDVADCFHYVIVDGNPSLLDTELSNVLAEIRRNERRDKSDA